MTDPSQYTFEYTGRYPCQAPQTNMLMNPGITSPKKIIVSNSTSTESTQNRPRPFVLSNQGMFNQPLVAHIKTDSIEEDSLVKQPYTAAPFRQYSGDTLGV